MKKSRRIIAGALVGGGLLSAGFGTLAAPQASANVPSGKYTMIDGARSGPVTLRGNTLTIPGLGNVPFHQTPQGGYASVGAVSYVFDKHGNSYSGPIRFGPFTLGTTKLIPR